MACTSPCRDRSTHPGSSCSNLRGARREWPDLNARAGSPSSPASALPEGLSGSAPSGSPSRLSVVLMLQAALLPSLPRPDLRRCQGRSVATRGRGTAGSATCSWPPGCTGTRHPPACACCRTHSTRLGEGHHQWWSRAQGPSAGLRVHLPGSVSPHPRVQGPHGLRVPRAQGPSGLRVPLQAPWARPTTHPGEVPEPGSSATALQRLEGLEQDSRQKSGDRQSTHTPLSTQALA